MEHYIVTATQLERYNTGDSESKEYNNLHVFVNLDNVGRVGRKREKGRDIFKISPLGDKEEYPIVFYLTSFDQEKRVKCRTLSVRGIDESDYSNDIGISTRSIKNIAVVVMKFSKGSTTLKVYDKSLTFITIKNICPHPLVNTKYTAINFQDQPCYIFKECDMSKPIDYVAHIKKTSKEK